jgi:hypothetical protein
MHLGRVIAADAPDQVLNDPGVVASYLGTDAASIERSGRSVAGRVSGRASKRLAAAKA